MACSVVLVVELESFTNEAPLLVVPVPCEVEEDDVTWSWVKAVTRTAPLPMLPFIVCCSVVVDALPAV